VTSKYPAQSQLDQRPASDPSPKRPEARRRVDNLFRDGSLHGVRKAQGSGLRAQGSGLRAQGSGLEP